MGGAASEQLWMCCQPGQTKTAQLFSTTLTRVAAGSCCFSPAGAAGLLLLKKGQCQPLRPLASDVSVCHSGSHIQYHKHAVTAVLVVGESGADLEDVVYIFMVVAKKATERKMQASESGVAKEDDEW